MYFIFWTYKGSRISAIYCTHFSSIIVLIKMTLFCILSSALSIPVGNKESFYYWRNYLAFDNLWSYRFLLAVSQKVNSLFGLCLFRVILQGCSLQITFKNLNLEIKIVNGSPNRVHAVKNETSYLNDISLKRCANSQNRWKWENRLRLKWANRLSIVIARQFVENLMIYFELAPTQFIRCAA